MENFIISEKWHKFILGILDGCVMAANRCIYKSLVEKNSIIGGYPVKIVKKDIWWEG